MNRSDLGWRLFATSISILIHGVVVYLVIENTTSADIKISNQPLITQVELNFIPPPPDPDPKFSNVLQC